MSNAVLYGAIALLIVVWSLQQVSKRRKRDQHRERDRGLAAWAESSGLRYAPTWGVGGPGATPGPNDFAAEYPVGRRWPVLPLTADPIVSENVIWGRWNGEQVYAFDLAHTVASGGAKAGRVTATYEYAIVIAQVPVRVPRLEVHDKHLSDRLDRVFDIPHAPTGDAEFDRAFTVIADDPGWASAILTPSVRAELLRDPGARLCTGGDGALLIADGKLTPERARTLLDRLLRILAAVPATTWTSRSTRAFADEPL